MSSHRSYAGLILSLLRDEGPQSRSALSTATGLSPTTITKVVAPLLRRGYVREVGADRGGGVGRPAIILEPIPDAVTVCGVQIGVGVVRLGLADARAEIRRATAFTFQPSAPVGDVLDELSTRIRDLVSTDGGSRCIGIGVGAPGPVDADHRTNLLSINLGWREVHIADHLEQELSIPVVVDHNVRSMALAEARYGAWSRSDLAYLYVKSGVGMGLVLKGEPFYGGRHGVSEIGHIRVTSRGTLCACGQRGCLETALAEPYLVARLAEVSGAASAHQQDEPILRLIEEEADGGNEHAADLLREVLRHLSTGLAVVVNLLNPELILLGGTLSAASDRFVDSLRARTRKEVFPTLREQLRLERPSLADGGIAGGAAIALEALHFGGPIVPTGAESGVPGPLPLLRM